MRRRISEVNARRIESGILEVRVAFLERMGRQQQQ
jgi:hypothetical protein